MKDNNVFLKHISDEVNYIVKVTETIKHADLLGDETLKRAVLRSLEIIGEASKNFSKDFKEKHNDVQWKEISGLRDKLIHDYFGIDWEIVWDVVKNEIPALKDKLEKII